MEENSSVFLKNRHVRLFQKILNRLPGQMVSLDNIRPTILSFIVSGLDMLNSLEEVPHYQRLGICDWIYSHQVPIPADKVYDYNIITKRLVDDEDLRNEFKKYGFGCTQCLNGIDELSRNFSSKYAIGHLAMTYSCLCTLLILGDDLSHINRSATLLAIGCLQNENGSFQSSIINAENDMRFVYCASVICYILNDWSTVNQEKIIQFIKNSINYDGGIGLEPGLESHGGSTFCGLAALSLMGKLESTLTPSEISRVQRWLIMRQQSGFQGRPHKDPDTCYSFWIGAALKITGIFEKADWNKNKEYIISCQNSIVGGFSKYRYTEVDPMHSYFGLFGLSLMGEFNLKEMHPALNMSMKAYQHLRNLHKTWEAN